MSTVKDLARIVSDRHDIPISEAERFLNDMFNLLKEGLSIDEQVKIKGLGTFKVMTIQERKSVNVNTGQAIIIDSHDRISFTPDGSMKESVNKPFAHFETVPINDGVVFEDIEDIAEQTRLQIAVSDNQQQAQESQPAAVAESSEQEHPVTEIAAETITQQADEQTPGQDVETVAEAKPVDEPAAEQVSVSHQSANIELEQDKTNNNPIENTMDYLNPSKNDNSISVNIAIFISAIVFVIGIVIGRFTADMTYDSIKELFYQTERPVVQDEVEFTTVNESDLANEAQQKTHNTAEKIDSARKIAAAEAEARREQALKKAQEQVQAKNAAEEKLNDNTKKAAEAKAAQAKPAANTAKAAPAAAEQTNYNYSSDPRIRYGAYRIVGVQKTVTVQAGQTLLSISKAHLGPGMECYVEAINGTKVVKEGQVIKIPQLQIKKKKKAE